MSTPGEHEVQAAIRQAELLISRNDKAGARKLLRELIERAPREHLPYVRYSGLCVETLDYDEAERALLQALQRCESKAETHTALAEVLEDKGDRDGADRHYEQALALAPDSGYVIGALLGLRKERAGAELMARARALLDSDEIHDSAKALIGYGLGKAAESQGDYGQAMEAWQLANRARRRIAGDYDHAQMRARVDALIQAFTPELVERLAGASDGAGFAPLFVIGMPRSGTTLTEQILDRHPRLAGMGETTGMATVAYRMPAIGASILEWPQALSEIPAEALGYGAAAYRDLIHGLMRAADVPLDRRPIDKAPLNFFHVGLIALLYPEARIVHCLRDPRDVILSIYSENFATDQRQATDLADLTRYYAEYQRLMAHWHRLFPGRIDDLVYESVVTGGEAMIQRIIGFSGEDWDDACLQAGEGRRVVSTLSKWQVRKPMYTSSIGRWKRFGEALAPVFECPDYAELEPVIARCEAAVAEPAEST